MNNLSKGIFSFLFFLLLVILAWPSNGPIQISKENKNHVALYDGVKDKQNIVDSVVRISIQKDNKVLVYGTGFSVREQDGISYILTNDHICKNIIYGDIFAHLAENNKATNDFKNPIRLKWVSSNSEFDLCLLKADKHIPALKFSSKKPKALDKVKVIGSPGINFPIITESYFSGYIRSNEIINRSLIFKTPEEYLMISEVFKQGISGSPVLDSRNKVIGIIFAITVGYEDQPFPIRTSSYGTLAVKSDDIINFIEESI